MTFGVKSIFAYADMDAEDREIVHHSIIANNKRDTDLRNPQQVGETKWLM